MSSYAEMGIFPAEEVLANRQKKRRWVKEATKVAPILEAVNQKFLMCLFDENNRMSYDHLYRIYANEWEDAVKYCASLKLKYTIVNRRFFENQYKPRV